MDDAHLRGSFDGARSPTSSTARTSPRARPDSRSPSTCRRRPATTPSDELARGEVGKVGVPVAHRGDMKALLDGIPLDKMNTSMTINATAAWLLALYIVTAEEQGVDESQLPGTTQNDIIKEFLARGTYAFPPGPVDAADRGHDRLHRRAGPEVEPDQHLQLPPAGGGRDAGPGDRLRDEQRDRGPRRGPRARPARTAWAPSSAASRSSSTPACASSRSTPSCARWASSGRSSAVSATASPTPSSCASATACRSTRSG